MLLGSQGVGKTSIVVRYVQGTFNDTERSTIGASFFTHKMTIDDRRIKLQIWDTAGQERFRSMAPMYYRGAHAAIIVYDVTVKKSFSEVDAWIKQLKENCGENLVLCIVGNKNDLPNKAVSQDVAASYAKSVSALFCETSAKDDIGISEMFVHIAKLLLADRANAPTMKTNGTVRPGSEEAGKGKCC